MKLGRTKGRKLGEKKMALQGRQFSSFLSNTQKSVYPHSPGGGKIL
jgi:hypothetical protein